MGDEETSFPIRTECEAEYQNLSNAMWDQLVYLRTSMYLLRELAEFPLQRFASPDDQWFFTIVRRALYEAVVLGVTKLTTDSGVGVLTISRCRHLVMKMLRPELVQSFREQLKKASFDKARTNLRKRARDLRDARLAHLLLEDVRNGAVLLLAFADLEALVSEAEKLYQPLLFGASAKFLPFPYDPAVRAANPPTETDVERILRLFARDSYILNEPERNALWWPVLRKRKTDEEIEFINHWRKKVGLREV
jgi:AbiU2